MGMRATGSFEGKSWKEEIYSEADGGAKLARVEETNSYSGDIEGEGTLGYLTYYSGEGEGWGSGSFVGLEHVEGRVGDRRGSFVLRHEGTFEGDTVRATWSVVPGSGTGELRDLGGEGGFVARHGQEQTPYTLDYHFG
jgi:hypothetical protein